MLREQKTYSSLSEMLNTHLSIELKHSYHDDMIIQLSLRQKKITLISKCMFYIAVQRQISSYKLSLNV